MRTREVSGRPRRTCGACGHIHFTDPKVGVGVLVIRDDRLLLVRRAVDPERGRWAIPGGYLDAGEDPREKAALEVHEETGVEVRVTDLVDVFPGHPRGATMFVLYRGEWRRGEPVAGDDADDARFFRREDVPHLAFQSTRTAVDAWLQQG